MNLRNFFKQLSILSIVVPTVLSSELALAKNACKPMKASSIEQPTIQVRIDKRILQASAFNERGSFKEAIGLLGPLLTENHSFSEPAETGAAWNVLAFAYQGRGDSDAARRSYEKGINLLQGNSAMKLEFASAIDDFGSLLFEMREFKLSKKSRTRALELYERLGADLGMARAASGLALVALVDGHLKEAHRRLDEAFCRAELSGRGNEDEMA